MGEKRASERVCAARQQDCYLETACGARLRGALLDAGPGGLGMAFPLQGAQGLAKLRSGIFAQAGAEGSDGGVLQGFGRVCWAQALGRCALLGFAWAEEDPGRGLALRRWTEAGRLAGTELTALRESGGAALAQGAPFGVKDAKALSRIEGRCAGRVLDLRRCGPARGRMDELYLAELAESGWTILS